MIQCPCYLFSFLVNFEYLFRRLTLWCRLFLKRSMKVRLSHRLHTQARRNDASTARSPIPDARSRALRAPPADSVPGELLFTSVLAGCSFGTCVATLCDSMLGTQTSLTRNDDVQHPQQQQHYQRQAPQHEYYHQPQQKSMNDMVEFEDENGQVRLVPRHIAMGVPGAQHVGSFVRPAY